MDKSKMKQEEIKEFIDGNLEVLQKEGAIYIMGKLGMYMQDLIPEESFVGDFKDIDLLVSNRILYYLEATGFGAKMDFIREEQSSTGQGVKDRSILLYTYNDVEVRCLAPEDIACTLIAGLIYPWHKKTLYNILPKIPKEKLLTAYSDFKDKDQSNFDSLRKGIYIAMSEELDKIIDIVYNS